MNKIVVRLLVFLVGLPFVQAALFDFMGDTSMGNVAAVGFMIMGVFLVMRLRKDGQAGSGRVDRVLGWLWRKGKGKWDQRSHDKKFESFEAALLSHQMALESNQEMQEHEIQQIVGQLQKLLPQLRDMEILLERQIQGGAAEGEVSDMRERILLYRQRVGNLLSLARQRLEQEYAEGKQAMGLDEMERENLAVEIRESKQSLKWQEEKLVEDEHLLGEISDGDSNEARELKDSIYQGKRVINDIRERIRVDEEKLSIATAEEREEKILVRGATARAEEIDELVEEVKSGEPEKLSRAGKALKGLANVGGFLRKKSRVDTLLGKLKQKREQFKDWRKRGKEVFGGQLAFEEE